MRYPKRHSTYGRVIVKTIQLFLGKYSKWAKDYATFRESVFNILFADKIGLRERRIKELDTQALVEEFKDKKNGNVSLIRNEIQNRYKEGRDCEIISEAFNASCAKDQQWIKNQER